MNTLIPMAGLGDRFKKEGYDKPKPLIDVNGKPMIQRVIESLGIKFQQYIFVINKNIDQVAELKELLKTLTINPIIIEIDYLTEGPASTCLLAKEFINNDEPLIITNCDQIMEWNSYRFNHLLFNVVNNKVIDGLVVTYSASTTKNSYVKISEEGPAIQFAEKEIISEHSLNGIHYWRHGSDFVKSAEAMIKKDIRVNNEFYIAPTYNEMILEDKKIWIHPIENKEHWAVGTPEDLKIYLDHVNEI